MRRLPACRDKIHSHGRRDDDDDVNGLRKWRMSASREIIVSSRVQSVSRNWEEYKFSEPSGAG